LCEVKAEAEQLSVSCAIHCSVTRWQHVIDDIDTWFVVRIKNRVIPEPVELEVNNVVTGCVTETWPGNYITIHHIAIFVPFMLE